MFKISLMDHLDLEDAYNIELETNPSPWSKDNFFSSFEVGHKSLVCKYNDVIMGFLIFSLIKKESHLLNIAVLKEWQERGAGTILMDVFIKQSKAMGATKAFLEVRSKNTTAINFYSKFNFLKDAVRTNYYTGSNIDDAILMSLDL
ncbi:MAG: ribosomal-protein-alanine N-acetyltransferase [Gammaproteobacteria bacterium TMED226]|mgnify:FL=1|nr:MAG: ribosomal-protein-alanine N-acetyltransferase [Gammaproteobacteria bacterium TMED226]|tara:strand:- start:4884 stop:5321 length:438 start_codon:yes stop_codon:yes gene_type:complete